MQQPASTSPVVPMVRSARPWAPPPLAGFPAPLRLVQATMAALSPLAPDLMATAAWRLYFTPRRHRRPARETQWLERSEPLRVYTPYGELCAHAWGGAVLPWEAREERTVLLIHGWEGRGTQLGALVEPLVERGYRVVAVDMPAHGGSPGTQTDLLQWRHSILLASQQLGPVHAVVAHSMGGAASLMALEQGMETTRVAVLGAPARLRDVFDRYCAIMRLTPQVAARFLEMVEQHYGAGIWTAMSVEEMAPSFRGRGLLVHDVDDTDVPFEDAQRVARAWAGATLLPTAGLGHTRILRDAHVLAAVVDFVDG